VKTIRIRAYGTPKGQPRVKAYVRGRHAGVYTPDTANAWKMEVREAVLREPERPTTTGPVSVELAFWMPRPKGHLRKDGTLKPSAPEHHAQKPDIDNLAKAVLDVLTDLQVWADDAQVHSLEITRSWADEGWPSGCSIALQW
jgi:Holliday junction resolvase RusA-like endonuclease